MAPRRPRGGLRRAATKPRRVVGRRRPMGRRRPVQRGLPNRQLVQSSLGGLSLTRFVSARAPNAVAKAIKKVGAPNFVSITYPGWVEGGGGKQAYSSWYLNCANDLQRIWASIQGLQVGRLLPQDAWHPLGTPNNASFRYVLESAISNLHIANTSGTPLNIELYDLVAKRDSPQVAFDLSGNQLGTNIGQGNQYMDPSTAWYLGMQNQRNTASGFATAPGFNSSEYPDPSNLGATPYMSKLFKDFFKVVRKSNVSLPIGGQHKHYVDLKPNAIVDQDFMSQNAIYRGLSFFTLIVVSGVPVVGCPPNVDTDAPVSTSSVSLSVLQNIKYKYTWTEDTRENIYRANFITTVPTEYQSIQPSLVKVDNANTTLQTVSPTSVQFVSLPSECTR